MYLGIMLTVWFASFAMGVREGVWNNILNYSCIFLAGIISFGSFQSITRYIDEQLDGEYTYVLDFVVLWIMFAATVGILKAFCKSLSPKRVVFNEKVDAWLGGLIAFSTARLMVTIVSASLHIAPLPYDMFDGIYVVGNSYEEVKENYDFAPGARWLLVCEYILSDSAMGDSSFSASRFVYTYAEHRKTFAEADGYMVRRN